MKRQKGHGTATIGETLVDGLNHHERLAILERLVAADKYGVVDSVEDLRRRVEDLESADRRRRMPWYLRWWVACR